MNLRHILERVLFFNFIYYSKLDSGKNCFYLILPQKIRKAQSFANLRKNFISKKLSTKNFELCKLFSLLFGKNTIFFRMKIQKYRKTTFFGKKEKKI